MPSRNSVMTRLCHNRCPHHNTIRVPRNKRQQKSHWSIRCRGCFRRAWSQKQRRHRGPRPQHPLEKQTNHKPPQQLRQLRQTQVLWTRSSQSTGARPTVPFSLNYHLGTIIRRQSRSLPRQLNGPLVCSMTSSMILERESSQPFQMRAWHSQSMHMSLLLPTRKPLCYLWRQQLLECWSPSQLGSCISPRAVCFWHLRQMIRHQSVQPSRLVNNLRHNSLTHGNM